METSKGRSIYSEQKYSLYSLEKLIEWKLLTRHQILLRDIALYSLEKLIEWKLHSHRSQLDF